MISKKHTHTHTHTYFKSQNKLVQNVYIEEPAVITLKHNLFSIANRLIKTKMLKLDKCREI